MTAKLCVGKLAQLEVTILWVQKEQSVLRNKLQMVQELVISAYDGCSIHKPRVMLTEEDEYADGLYATNDSERNPKPYGANWDQKANGG